MANTHATHVHSTRGRLCARFEPVYPTYNPSFSACLLVGTVFFSHNELANSIFQPAYQPIERGICLFAALLRASFVASLASAAVLSTSLLGRLSCCRYRVRILAVPAKPSIIIRRAAVTRATTATYCASHALHCSVLALLAAVTDRGLLHRCRPRRCCLLWPVPSRHLEWPRCT
jgi:hypothetical protein